MRKSELEKRLTALEQEKTTLLAELEQAREAANIDLEKVLSSLLPDLHARAIEEQDRRWKDLGRLIEALLPRFVTVTDWPEPELRR